MNTINTPNTQSITSQATGTAPSTDQIPQPVSNTTATDQTPIETTIQERLTGYLPEELRYAADLYLARSNTSVFDFIDTEPNSPSYLLFLPVETIKKLLDTYDMSETPHPTDELCPKSESRIPQITETDPHSIELPKQELLTEAQRSLEEARKLLGTASRNFTILYILNRFPHDLPFQERLIGLFQKRHDPKGIEVNVSDFVDKNGHIQEPDQIKQTIKSLEQRKRLKETLTEEGVNANNIQEQIESNTFQLKPITVDEEHAPTKERAEAGKTTSVATEEEKVQQFVKEAKKRRDEEIRKLHEEAEREKTKMSLTLQQKVTPDQFEHISNLIASRNASFEDFFTPTGNPLTGDSLSEKLAQIDKRRRDVLTTEAPSTKNVDSIAPEPTTHIVPPITLNSPHAATMSPLELARFRLGQPDPETARTR